jgi:hypothetical protein
MIIPINPIQSKELYCVFIAPHESTQLNSGEEGADYYFRSQVHVQVNFAHPDPTPPNLSILEITPSVTLWRDLRLRFEFKTGTSID